MKEVMVERSELAKQHQAVPAAANEVAPAPAAELMLMLSDIRDSLRNIEKSLAGPPKPEETEEPA